MMPSLVLQLQGITKAKLKNLVLGYLAQLMILLGSLVWFRGERSASFVCEYFLIFFQHFISNKFYRSKAAEDSSIKVGTYGDTTATATLRSHLLKFHPQEWVKECERLNIRLRGKEGKIAMAKFSGVPVGHQAATQAPFTQENFREYLMQFIIATDQVFIYLFYFI